MDLCEEMSFALRIKNLMLSDDTSDEDCFQYESEQTQGRWE